MAELLTDDALPLGHSASSVQQYLWHQRIFEEDALRRVARMVADGAEPSAVFDAVIDEVRRCIPASHAGLWRFEARGEMTWLSGDAEPASLAECPLGFRTLLSGDTLSAAVYRTGRPARRDTDEDVGGLVSADLRQLGVHSAVGVPVIADGRIWGLVAVGSVHPCSLPAETEARLDVFAELIATVVVPAYREEQLQRLVGEETRCPLLMDALLYGRILDQWSVWEVAHRLRLPIQGPFVVVAAAEPVVGAVALPAIESKLRSLDVYSAWRVLPDLQVGIVHTKSEQHLDKILALLSRTAPEAVGVSASFDDLRDTPQAFHVAKVTLRSRAHNACRVVVFDGSILATAAVSAPEVMVKAVGTVLEAFDDLDDDERRLLFETFRVWQESDASVRATAEVLICHPNTVRYRLRRIEQRTGRSLSRPRDIAELCLAFEVQRYLMH
jgi:hypothetical protein